MWINIPNVLQKKCVSHKQLGLGSIMKLVHLTPGSTHSSPEQMSFIFHFDELCAMVLSLSLKLACTVGRRLMID